MGLKSRVKGKVFERQIAAVIRERWPDALVRRASQAERADNPDVFCEGGPPVLQRLWLELQDAVKPTPLAKLEQATDDAMAWLSKRLLDDRAKERYPVVVWHRIREHSINVTTYLWVIAELVVAKVEPHKRRHEMITLDLEDFLPMLEATG